MVINIFVDGCFEYVVRHINYW